jgi:hypothetical protein
MASESPARASRRAGGPVESMSLTSLPAGNSGKPLAAQIDARAQKATSKGLRGLFLRKHLILAKGG